MEEGLGVTAQPQQKIKLTPKAIDLAENSSAFLDPTSDTSGDDGKEAKSAIQGIHCLLGPRKEETETQHYKSTKIYDLEYQHLDNEVTSDDGEVQVSSSKSDSDAKVEGESYVASLWLVVN